RRRVARSRCDQRNRPIPRPPAERPGELDQVEPLEGPAVMHPEPKSLEDVPEWLARRAGTPARGARVRAAIHPRFRGGLAVQRQRRRARADAMRLGTGAGEEARAYAALAPRGVVPLRPRIAHPRGDRPTPG